VTFFRTFFLTYLPLFILTVFLAYLPTFFLAFALEVEARQGTLAADGRGWGLVGSTGGRAQRLAVEVRRARRVACGREHWAWLLAVDVWQGTLASRLRSDREHWAWLLVWQRTLET